MLEIIVVRRKDIFLMICSRNKGKLLKLAI